METKKDINQSNQHNHYHLLAHQQKKQLTISCKYLLAGFLLLIIVGCTNSQTTDLTPIENRLTEIENRLSEIEPKVTTIEVNQLTSDDIRTLVDLRKQNKTTNYNDEDLPQGCPSKSKLNFWFEKWQEKDINKRQYKIIEDKYNSVECQ